MWYTADVKIGAETVAAFWKQGKSFIFLVNPDLLGNDGAIASGLYKIPESYER